MDLIVVGGGLAGGLLASRLLARHPELDFRVLEAGDSLGGNHTWSFHDTDVSPAQLEWLLPFAAYTWHAHDVEFPSRRRTIQGGYHSIRSEDFHRTLLAALGARVQLGAGVAEIKADEVRLVNGSVLRARCVIDARGFSTEHDRACGYQKFLGLDVTLERPHGLNHPVLMDARVDQLDGFRFVYLLPWSDRSLLVEDTYYSDTPSMDRDNVRARINSYLSDRGWSIETVHREESAALPIPLDGAPPPVTIPTIGVRAGFFHATTGYSLAVAARIAEAISAQSAFDPESITRLTQQLSTAHWKQQGFFRMLNRLLFEAALPAARRAVFESFYGHDEALVAHFYAGRLSPIEIARVLARGSRTVAPGAAIRAAVGTRRT